ncbi:MAG: prephenate dehydratase [Methanobacteriaceae archaeon]|nr:prephenate dehydratase [Methanobacteriaceae archaeon]
MVENNKNNNDNDNNKVSFLGPKGTFSHEAAAYVSDNLISYCSIPEVMQSVVSGECVKGIVPIENSIEGPVNLTLDSLIHDFDLNIVGEIIIPINHNLLAPYGINIDDITEVYSHSQALSQCRQYLEEHGMNPNYTVSTAEAARKVSEGEGTYYGAIATVKAAEIYGLNVIDRNIQEKSNNQTRFIVLSKDSTLSTGCDKTSIAFSLFEDRPGGLYDILGLFARDNINLTKIESRPSKEGLGSYVFFIDFEGHQSDDNIKSILDTLKSKTSFIKILGSYPIFNK